MAADSDGCTAVVTCEGDLSDPEFAERFEGVVGELNGILGEAVQVRKLEPWNSVRVTLSIPREAALRLRKLASEGSAQLRALGILSVQVEGDQVISLRVASAISAEPQEIRLQTTQDGSGGSSQAESALGRFLGAAPPEFKSPNVVCPPDGVVPKAAPNSALAPPTSTKGYHHSAPFPFTSMNQAIHSQVNFATASSSSSSTSSNQPPPPPPPPYPGKHPAVTISSPLLVNLLQNDGASPSSSSVKVDAPPPVNNNSAVKSRTVPPPRTIVTNRTVPPPPLPPQQQQQKNTKPPQASTSSSPSALSNTSIRQNSKPNSTITLPPYPSNVSNVNSLPPPPPYSVAVNRQWDSVVQTSPFLDLTPSLTDLKADDLEHLLPTLERDLARSPPEIPEELTRPRDKRNFLINPLTGELEPQSSGGESDNDDDLGDVFTGLPSPAAISDEDTNSTIRPDTTDQSDSETRSSHSDSGKHRAKSKVARDRGRDSPNLKPTEKIKLRLKLEKSEPINSAYKVDVSFIQQPKKASTSVTTPTTTTTPPTPAEELRVPPLHISLRGRHHAFITNKKKKLNPDKPKMRKAQDLSKTKRDPSAITDETEEKKKKFKNHEDGDLISKLVIHSKEKQKERRGSDSELSRKFVDSNGIISAEKKRRLSQSDPVMDVVEPTILGSTNVGTITGLPQKPRKDKSKVKDVFKNKDVMRSKSFAKSLGEKFTKQVALPTGEIDMEAKFKQRLMEGTEKGIPRPPHRTTEGVHQVVVVESNQMEKSEQVIKVESEPPPLQEKSPEPDKCNTPDRKQPGDLVDKHQSSSSTGGRSPNSGAQGEDSGIESMDALSEKSPNQASQSPHADIPEPPPMTTTTAPTTIVATSSSTTTMTTDNHVVKTSSSSSSSKTQVPDMMPDMLDIEAQLAKMEGLNGAEDVKLGQCCELTSALQDSLKQGTVSLSSVNASGPTTMAQLQTADVSLVPVKSKTKEDDLEPLPVRVTPPLYTYSNPEKTTTRAGSESPTLSDEEDSIPPPPPQQHNNKAKSLLEQLLIEIPDGSQTTPTASSPSPATRSSMRTRAHSKVGSPELNSPSSMNATTTTKTTTTTTATTRVVTPANSNVTTTTAKRKRHESDSSNNSTEDPGAAATRNKKTRKCSENAAELIKACMGVDNAIAMTAAAAAAAVKVNNVKKGVAGGAPPPPPPGGGGAATAPQQVAGKPQDESSDSDEPLIEKVRKTASNNGVGKKLKSGGGGMKGTVNTRRSVRTAPATNTRSKGDKVTDTEAALRRKTRSAVSEGDSKRKKEVK